MSLKSIFARTTLLLIALGVNLMSADSICAAEPELSKLKIGYTELRTNLPGGRHANVRTFRAAISQADGSDKLLVAESLVDNQDVWTQFAGWSPDGRQAIILRGWQDPQNATWEEEHKRFRMEKGKWELDTILYDLESGAMLNVSDVERVSHYNGGLFYLPDNAGLGFTPLIDGKSQTYLMDLDGSNKRNVTGEDSGFAYGYSASPQGDLISYHENYQIFLSQPDGSGKMQIETGNSFNFGPSWSPDGEWIMFLSGKHYQSNPYLVRRDGTGLRKLVDLGGYESHILFLDVPDYHQGSSDLPVWSTDGKLVFYTAIVNENVELFQCSLAGEVTQLTNSPSGTLHYHPQPSPDGKWLLYGSMRKGVRQLVVMNVENRTEFEVTHLSKGHAAMWPHWCPYGE
ncbi:translocation protein TolB [Polystyrenella longa]|uniref:Translocation protein TolB n=1 Tax=Polystyrenella longa TaxID=2528007 RepID=A0A518CMA8_9PLAN|nr:PD40 domain-containing protein [Polystyrenella longa]QDU80333.1 translocation protein TolB [Polystyrenella longa]